MKKLLTILLTLAMIITMVGCSEEGNKENEGDNTPSAEPRYGYENVKLDLPEGFTETRDDSEYDYVLTGNGVLIMCSKATLEEIQQAGYPDLSLRALTEIIINGDSMESWDDYGNYQVFTYTADEYFYFVATYLGEKDFLVVDFVCKADEMGQHRNDFANWATKVTVE